MLANRVLHPIGITNSLCPIRLSNQEQKHHCWVQTVQLAINSTAHSDSTDLKFGSQTRCNLMPTHAVTVQPAKYSPYFEFGYPPPRVASFLKWISRWWMTRRKKPQKLPQTETHSSSNSGQIPHCRDLTCAESNNVLYNGGYSSLFWISNKYQSTDHTTIVWSSYNYSNICLSEFRTAPRVFGSGSRILGIQRCNIWPSSHPPEGHQGANSPAFSHH